MPLMTLEMIKVLVELEQLMGVSHGSIFPDRPEPLFRVIYHCETCGETVSLKPAPYFKPPPAWKHNNTKFFEWGK